MAVSMLSSHVPAEQESQQFSPVEFYGLDDIMNEVGLFMDVAMMDGSTDLPKDDTEPTISMLADIANSVPIPVTPSPSSINLVSDPIAELEKSKWEAMAQHSAAVVTPTKPAVAQKKTVVKKAKQPVKPVTPRSTLAKKRSTASVVSDDGQPTEKLSEERRNRNREHAKRSRQRKKSLTEALQKSVDDLKKENAYLKEQLDIKIGKMTRETLIKDKVVTLSDSFINTIMNNPGNTTLNVSTVKYLKSLSDTVKVNMQAQQ